MAQAPGNSHSSIGTATNTRRGFLQFLRLPPPKWLPESAIVVLALLGLAAFAVTGFSGDQFSPSWLSSAFFSYPIVLFGWLFILLAGLQWLMLRDPLPSSGLVASPLRRGIALGTTGMMIVLIAAFAIIASRFPSLLNQVANQSGASILHLVVCAVNAWIVGGLAFIGIRGALAWLMRRLRHQVGTGMARQAAEGFIAAAMLLAVLTFLSNVQVLSALANVFQSTLSLFQVSPLPHISLDPCIGLIIPTCDQHLPYEGIYTWTGLDLRLIFACGFTGGVILALDVFLRGNASGIIGEEDEIEGVAKDAFLFRLVRDLLWPMRHLLWPPCILLAVLGEAFAAVFIQMYLHFLSARHEAGLSFQFHPEHYVYLPIALAFAILPVLAMAAAVSLHLWGFPAKSFGQMAGYWLAGLLQLGVVALLPFAILSACLSFGNWAWTLFAPPAPLPFWPPGLSTVVPVGLYIIIVAVIRLRERRSSSSHI